MMKIEDKKPQQLLRDPRQMPNETLFKGILHEQLFQSYKEIQRILIRFGLSGEWRFYKDGKTWLYKVTHKKKTVVWLSLWEDFFKSSFYFTEKNKRGIMDLTIDDTVKKVFLQRQAIGRLIPLILDIHCVDEITDFEKVVEYKLSLK